MARLTKDRSQLLDKLVSDCITFRLYPKESLQYIEKEYPGGRILERTYFRRRAKLLSDNTRNLWYSNFARIGFVDLHKKTMDVLQTIQDDSLRRLHEESQKPDGNRDNDLILKLKKDIKETCEMLTEYGSDTPVITAIKAKLDRTDHKSCTNGRKCKEGYD